MLKTQITGAKYLSPQTNQMTNLNIAVPADSKDTEFGTSDILLAKDTVKIIDDKIANKKSFKFVETLPNKIEDVDPDVIYIVTGNNTHTKNVEIINTASIGGGVNDGDKYYEYVFLKYENKHLYYEQLGKSNELPLIKGNNETSVSTIKSTANGDFSTALGMDCTTNNPGECAVGYFNRSTESDDPSEQTLFSVGNGWNGFKNNAFEVKANGDVYMGYGSLDPDGGMASFKLQEFVSRINEVYNNINNMFEVVTELPDVTDAETSKIYCIKDSKSTDNQNIYVEYALVEGEDGDYHFEKLGLFNAEPDLSGYAKLSGANFTGPILGHQISCDGISVIEIVKRNNKYLLSNVLADRSATKTYTTDGSIVDLDTKANASDVLLKKSASGGYYIEENSNELGLGAFAVTSMCTASGTFAYAEGGAIASGMGAHAEGGGTASGAIAHAEGQATASGDGAHAEGQATASGENSHALNDAEASGRYSHAEILAIASGDFSHAEGSSTASGDFSHAEGRITEASGMGTHTEGYSATASGMIAHAEGLLTIASGYCSHAQGSYNIEDKNAIHSVGIGNKTTRKNAEYIYAKNAEKGTGLTDDPKNGYKYLIGVGGYDGISTDNTTYKSVQEVIADLTTRIEQLETKVRALEAANTPA